MKERFFRQLYRRNTGIKWGHTLRENFNDQDYPYHALHPHGKGKLIYRDGDTILEEYEGEFEAGQYHGKGTLVIGMVKLWKVPFRRINLLVNIAEWYQKKKLKMLRI